MPLYEDASHSRSRCKIGQTIARPLLKEQVGRQVLRCLVRNGEGCDSTFNLILRYMCADKNGKEPNSVAREIRTCSQAIVATVACMVAYLVRT